MSIGRNVTANYLGQAWTAVIGLVFIPVYIRYMGVESFGLIGVFTLLQAWLALLDMGMTPTLNREMARFTAGAHTPQSIRDLLRSLELIALAMSAAIGVLVWAAADWLAADWLRVEKLPLETVSQAIALMGLVVAMRFLEGLYRGAMLGLQQQVLYNAANAFFATLRAAGAVAVLAWVAPTIGAYFAWQGIVSVLALAYMAVAVHRLLPSSPRSPRYSGRAVRDIWRFAGGMMATACLSILLTQVDKILLSHLLTLDAFGYYTFATMVASVIGLLIAPITQAAYPRFTELVEKGESVPLVAAYHQSAELVTVIVGAIALMLVFFPAEILFVWTSDPKFTHEVALLVRLLAFGTFLNGLMHIPYMLQLAHGWSWFAVKVNLVAVIILIPVILWAVPRYGAVGAAYAWVLLNAGYVLITIQIMHKRILPGEQWKWYWKDICIPLSAAAAMAAILRLFQLSATDSAVVFMQLSVVGIAIISSAALVSPGMRAEIFRVIRRKFRNEI